MVDHSPGPDRSTVGEAPPAPPRPVVPATSRAVVTLPNLISAARILLVPVCALLLLREAWVAALWLTALVGATDWVDGWLARRLGMVSRIGQLIDPFADRLLIAAVALALLARGVVPLAAVVLLLARDVLLLGGFAVLARRGVRPPDVIWLGKATTLVLLVALPLLVWGQTQLVLAPAAEILGLAGLWVGVAGYWVTGGIYLRKALDDLRAPVSPGM